MEGRGFALSPETGGVVQPQAGGQRDARKDQLLLPGGGPPDPPHLHGEEQRNPEDPRAGEGAHEAVTLLAPAERILLRRLRPRLRPAHSCTPFETVARRALPGCSGNHRRSCVCCGRWGEDASTGKGAAGCPWRTGPGLQARVRVRTGGRFSEPDTSRSASRALLRAGAPAVGGGYQGTETARYSERVVCGWAPSGPPKRPWSTRAWIPRTPPSSSTSQPLASGSARTTHSQLESSGLVMKGPGSGKGISRSRVVTWDSCSLPIRRRLRVMGASPSKATRNDCVWSM